MSKQDELNWSNWDYMGLESRQEEEERLAQRDENENKNSGKRIKRSCPPPGWRNSIMDD